MKNHRLTGKLALLFLVMTALLLCGVGVTAYNQSRNRVENQYAITAASAANMAAHLIPSENIDDYLEFGANDEYWEVYRELQALRQSYNLAYLYVSVPVEGQNDTIYVFDVALEGDDPAKMGALGEHTGPGDAYDLVSELYHSGKEGDMRTRVTDGEYGYLASAYAPLLDEFGKPAAVIGIDISMERILSQVRTGTFQTLGVTASIILLFMLVLLFAVNRSVVRPIRRLSAHMEHFVSGDGGMEEFHLNTGDELEAMADSFNKMIADLQLYTKNLARVTAEQQRVETELNVATQIQTSMLPSTFPPFPEHSEFDLYASMVPAREVGGDFYDFFMIDEGHIGLLVADVSGKGVPAALFMVIAKILLKDQATHSLDPAAILMAVNDKLCDNNLSGFFITVFLGILEIETGRFVYGNAGHNPPLLMKNGVYRTMAPPKNLVLAAMEGYPYVAGELTLNRGDRLLLYTDGVTEAMNPDGQLLSEGRLLQALNREAQRAATAEDTVDLVNSEVFEFAQGEEQSDDITVLSLIYRKQNEKGAEE